MLPNQIEYPTSDEAIIAKARYIGLPVVFMDLVSINPNDPNTAQVNFWETPPRVTLFNRFKQIGE